MPVEDVQFIDEANSFSSVDTPQFRQRQALADALHTSFEISTSRTKLGGLLYIPDFLIYKAKRVIHNRKRQALK
jgi:hypothetical protein